MYPNDLTKHLEYIGRVLSVKLHSVGINLRFIGQLRKLVSSPYWRLIFLKQMVTRRLKSFYLIVMQQTKESSSLTHVRSLLNYFNLVFGNSAASNEFWDTLLLPSLTNYFGPLDDAPERDFKKFSLSVENDRIFGAAASGWSAFRFFVDLSKRLALDWSDATIARFKRSPIDLIELSEPFGITDLDAKGLPLLVKHIPYGFYARGKVKMLEATQLTGSAAHALFWGAAALFARACDVITSPMSLRNLALCVAFANQQSAATLYFSLALKVDPGNRAKTFQKWAFVKEAGREFEAAEDLYLKSIEESIRFGRPKANAVVSYVDFLAGQGQEVWLEPFYRAVLHLNPRHFRSMFNLALCLGRACRNDQALECCEEALPLAADDGSRANVLRLKFSLLKELNQSDEKLLEIELQLDSLNRDGLAPSPAVQQRGAWFLFASNACDEAFSYLAKYLGPRSREVRQLEISLCKTLPDLNNFKEVNIEDAIQSHAAAIVKTVKYPIVCEIAYIRIDGHYWTSSSSLKAVASFASEHHGRRATMGVFVAHHDFVATCLVYKSEIQGQISSQPRGEALDSWEALFEPDGYEGSTLSELSPNIRPFASFRREAYCRLLAKHSV